MNRTGRRIGAGSPRAAQAHSVPARRAPFQPTDAPKKPASTLFAQARCSRKIDECFKAKFIQGTLSIQFGLP
jgi:hypothetical protein